MLSRSVRRAAQELAAAADGVAPDAVRLVRTLSGTWIALTDRVVVKVHGPETSAADLSRRLRLAADPGLRGCVLAPLRTDPVRLDDAPDDGPSGGGWATVWPRVEPLPQEIEAAPWAEAGALLARLHRSSTLGSGEGLPVQGSVRRVRGSLDRLAAVLAAVPAPGMTRPHGLQAAADVVRAAARGLPAASWDPDGGPGRPSTLVHGDWHLGQLGRVPGEEPDRWRLIDVDDLGVGDPAWDLARPAAFWAAGLMPDADWGAFVGAYRAAGGPALPPPPADPWPALDAVAQASVVLAAAGAVRRAVLREAPLEEMDARLVELCARLPGSTS